MPPVALNRSLQVYSPLGITTSVLPKIRTIPGAQDGRQVDKEYSRSLEPSNLVLFLKGACGKVSEIYVHKNVLRGSQKGN